MTKEGNQDWLDAIAAKAEVEPEVALGILNGKGIRPSPVVASPRRLTIRRIAFSGVKTGIPTPGPFAFVWDDLDCGLWATVTERNFKGKSSIIEVVRWMLRGRASDRLQQDIKGWIQQCSLTFSLDDVMYEVRAETPMTVSGRLVRIDSRKIETELASFVGDSAFEAVMSDFFLREFGLGVVSRWKKGTEDESGKAVLHGWLSLSGAMFIGTNYSVLLGDMPPESGMTAPLMQMYLGLPWVPTLTAAKAAEQGVKTEQEARERRRLANDTRRKGRRDAISDDLERIRRERDATPSDEEVRAVITLCQSELGAARNSELDGQERAERARTAFRAAESAYITDRRELQTHIDAEAAGAVFRMLDPSFCPRCDAAITDERRRREKDAHSCSVCGGQVEDIEDGDSVKASLEARAKASKSARDKAWKSCEDAEAELTRIRIRIGELDSNIRGLTPKLAEFGAWQRLDKEVAALEARLLEAAFDSEPAIEDNTGAAVLKVAVAETEKRVKAVQGGILQAVSDEIVRYANSFGMTNLTSATLQGNTHLKLVKGGNETAYSKCTEGEKLRLKVAAVLAMIKVAEKQGVGRHPGMLMIDSPGAQEVAREDLDQLISGLKAVAKGFSHLQVFIAALSSPSIVDHVSRNNMLCDKGEDTLW